MKTKELKNQTGVGPTEKQPVLYCHICGSTYSANAGDYWGICPDAILECCNEPLQLVIKRVVYEAIKDCPIDPTISNDGRKAD